MFLRRTQRNKNGKAHSYWNVVENKRLDDGRVVQRQVLYLGEISSSQVGAWRKAIEVLDEDAGEARRLTLFAEDVCEAAADEASVVRLRLSALRLCRPRQWGACWLAGQLWRELQLDRFWADRLPASRKGTRWDQILQVLVAYRLIAPGSEWKLHRDCSAAVPWPTCWAATSDWLRCTSSTPATTACWRTRKRCSPIWSTAGATCSTPRSTCCSTI
jgi:hypothetical protein